MKRAVGIILAITLILFAGIGVIYVGAEEPVRSVVIEDGVTSIAKYQYFLYGYLENVTVPGSVESIGFSAFDGCTSLKDVQLEEGLITMDNRSFAKCKSLTSIEIPDTVLTIGNASFYGCTSLENIKLSDSLTQIDNNLFYQCDALQNIVIPEKVTVIGRQSFYGCQGLTQLSLPVHLKSIEDGAFYDCNNLEALYVPSSVTYIGEDAFCGCDKLTIYCESGSYAQQYAMAQGIKASTGKILKKDAQSSEEAAALELTAQDVPKTGIEQPYVVCLLLLFLAAAGLIFMNRTGKWDQLKG